MSKSPALSAAAIAVAVMVATALSGGPRPAAAQSRSPSGSLLVNVVNLDIVPADIDRFMQAAKTNAAASMKDRGCREFDIVVAQDDPHHLLFFEVYDDAAALEAHRATDHFKTYMATTKDMVAKRETRQFSSAAMNAKQR